jgi:PAS domain S-box-containing protein
MNAPDGTRTARQAEARFEEIAESLCHLVWLADADGSTDYFNERGTQYTGFPRQKNYGWGWLDLVHPDDTHSARVSWEHATRSVTPLVQSFRIRRSDGEFRWHAFRALPVRGAANEIVRWIGTADDVQELVHASHDAALVDQQTGELRALLEAVQPHARARFGFVDPATRAARLESAFDADPAGGRGRSNLAAGATDGLTARELAVLRLIAAGYTNYEMANVLGLSLRSIEASRARLRQGLGLRSRAELVRFAYDAGLTDPGL